MAVMADFLHMPNQHYLVVIISTVCFTVWVRALCIHDSLQTKFYSFMQILLLL